MDKITATNEELETTQNLSKVLLTLATSQVPHVGMTSLIMATCVAARALDIPLHQLNAMLDKTSLQVYEAAERNNFGAPLH